MPALFKKQKDVAEQLRSQLIDANLQLAQTKARLADFASANQELAAHLTQVQALADQAASMRSLEEFEQSLRASIGGECGMVQLGAELQWVNADAVWFINIESPAIPTDAPGKALTLPVYKLYLNNQYVAAGPRERLMLIARQIMESRRQPAQAPTPGPAEYSG